MTSGDDATYRTSLCVGTTPTGWREDSGQKLGNALKGDISTAGHSMTMRSLQVCGLYTAWRSLFSFSSKRCLHLRYLKSVDDVWYAFATLGFVSICIGYSMPPLGFAILRRCLPSFNMSVSFGLGLPGVRSKSYQRPVDLAFSQGFPRNSMHQPCFDLAPTLCIQAAIREKVNPPVL